MVARSYLFLGLVDHAALLVGNQLSDEVAEGGQGRRRAVDQVNQKTGCVNLVEMDVTGFSEILEVIWELIGLSNLKPTKLVELFEHAVVFEVLELSLDFRLMRLKICAYHLKRALKLLVVSGWL